MSFVLGMDAVINYKVGGRAAVGDWLELSNVREVTLDLTKAEADVTTRANDGWRATVGTLKEGTVEFEMIYDQNDAGFVAAQEAYFDNSILGLQVLDDDGYGLEADFVITDFSQGQPLEEAVTVSVTAKITRSTSAPTYGDTTTS